MASKVAAKSDETFSHFNNMTLKEQILCCHSLSAAVSKWRNIRNAKVFFSTFIHSFQSVISPSHIYKSFSLTPRGETGIPGRYPCKHEENMQTSIVRNLEQSRPRSDGHLPGPVVLKRYRQRERARRRESAKDRAIYQSTMPHHHIYQLSN